jgi:hypothetical protein
MAESAPCGRGTNLFSGLTALSAEFTIGEGELMAHDVPLGCAPDEYDDLISGTCSHLPFVITSGIFITFSHIGIPHITEVTSA